MERRRVAIAFMIVMLLGAISLSVGGFIALGLGVDQGGILYNAISNTSIGLYLLVIIGASLFASDPFKDEQNQSQAEPDSSLI